jgi:hypothetical protein
MKRLLLTAAALALLTPAAQAGTAKPYILHQGKYWQTYAMTKNNDGIPMCGMQTMGDRSSFFIKWTPSGGMWIQIWKYEWRLTAATGVSFQLEFIDNAKPGENETLTTKNGWATPSDSGYGSSLYVNIDGEDHSRLLQVFGEADRVLINFLDGDERCGA